MVIEISKNKVDTTPPKEGSYFSDSLRALAKCLTAGLVATGLGCAGREKYDNGAVIIKQPSANTIVQEDPKITELKAIDKRNFEQRFDLGMSCGAYIAHNGDLWMFFNESFAGGEMKDGVFKIKYYNNRGEFVTSNVDELSNTFKQLANGQTQFFIGIGHESRKVTSYKP